MMLKNVFTLFIGLIFSCAALSLSATNRKVECDKTEPLLCLESIDVNGKVTLFVNNQSLAPYTLLVQANRLKNYQLQVLTAEHYVYPAKSKKAAFSLTVIDKTKVRGWGYRYRWQRGRLDVKHDDTVIYRLPFAKGEGYKVSQGFKTNFTHKGSDSYGIDFTMPVGSAVHAARDGMVVAVKADSTLGGANPKYRNQANFVVVDHSDGTLGEYYHLKYEGVRVKPGQMVKVGDLLGFSGNTGFSTAPHLHFSVHSSLSGVERRSHPIRFATKNGIKTLQQNKIYFVKK